MTHQRKHVRTSRRGRKFVAGRKNTWILTNERTRETYRFQRMPDGTIKTLEFLGYKTPKGKLIKP